MSGNFNIVDEVRIDNKHLVLISNNRINFISNVDDSEIDSLVENERSIIDFCDIKDDRSISFGPCIAFMPTFDCNLRCIYCYARGGESKDKLSFANAKKIIDFVVGKTNNPRDIPLTLYFVGGGEPFMNFKLIDEICVYSKNCFSGVEIIMVSNGVFGNKERQWIIDNNVAVRISFDGVMHQKNRPFPTSKSSSAIVEETIRILALENIPLTIQLTVSNDGIPTMIDSIDLISSLGGRYIKIEPVHNSVISRGRKTLVPDLKKFVDMFLSALKWICEQELPLKIDNSFMSRPTSGYYCGAGEGNNMIVTPSGLITGCLEIAKREAVFSDVMIYGSVSEEGGVVLNKDKRIFLDKLHWRNYPECPKCNLKLICGGGCPMQGGWDNNNLLTPSSYICNAHKMIIPKIFSMVFEHPGLLDVVFDNHVISTKCL